MAGEVALALLPLFPGQVREPDLALELEALVDLETPGARRQAAAALASRCGADLDLLLEAARGFGRFGPIEPGDSVAVVPLRVGDRVEETELHLHVPPGYDPLEPAPLLVAFHGTGGSGGDMIPLWSAIADRVGMVVLAPTEAGENQGYRFEERERLSALAALRHVRRLVNVDENRLFATGVSRGGHLVWDLALRFPDRFAGIAPMIGAPRLETHDDQNNLRYVENVARLPIRDLQGEGDDPRLVSNVKLAFERLSALVATDAELFLQPGLGHAFDLGAVDWEEFFRTVRDPLPDRVVRLTARAGEGRASWVDVTRCGPSVREEFALEVPRSEWNSLDDEGRRRRIVREAEERTARLEVLRAGPNRFEARGRGVEEFRLLLPLDDFDPRDAVEVSFDGERKEKRLRPSARVLLLEFAERFDRTFLPVAQLEVR
jgi:predicted esterase